MRLHEGLHVRNAWGTAPRILAAFVLITASAVATPSPATAADPTGSRALETVASPDALVKPSSMPIARPGADAVPHARALPGETCTDTSANRSVCIAVAKPSGRPAPITTLAPVPFPSWCAGSGGASIADSRTEACRITGLILTTRRTVNGNTQITGELSVDVYDYTYGSADLPNWIHQIGVAPWTGWGDAVNSTVTGTFSVAGDCVTDGVSSFPVQSLSPMNNVSRVGEAGARTTATAVNAIGYCTTTWSLSVLPTGYPVARASSAMNEMSCDNAIGANLNRPARVGCVVPWYPAEVIYSMSRYPSLATHVDLAQSSGLPGGTLFDPLNRNVNDADINQNRNLACGDAPSIAGKSCDEYPLATTYQGLAFGGTRRTFTGCNINAPTGVTGPTGVSACMITATENSAQGALMAAFYYDYRVLGGDPYRVGIGS